MSHTRAFFQNFVCAVLAGMGAYYLSIFIGSQYCSIGNCSAGIASVDFTAVVGLLLGYFLFIPLFLRLFGSSGKNWWIVILTIPILVWTIYMNIRLMELVPFVVSVAIGFLLGTLANKALTALVPSFMAKIA